MPNFISEGQIEKAAVSLLHDRYGYRTLNCFTQGVEDLADRSNRAAKEDVVFLDALKAAAIKLNSALTSPLTIQSRESRHFMPAPRRANPYQCERSIPS